MSTFTVSIPFLFKIDSSPFKFDETKRFNKILREYYLVRVRFLEENIAKEDGGHSLRELRSERDAETWWRAQDWELIYKMLRKEFEGNERISADIVDLSQSIHEYEHKRWRLSGF